MWKQYCLFMACSLFVMATVNVLQIAHHYTTVGSPHGWNQAVEIIKLAVTSLLYFGAVRFGQRGW